MNSLYAMESGSLVRYLDALNRVNMASISEALTRERPRLYNATNGEAVIPVRGVLSDNPSIFDILLGYAPALTYSEIVDAIDQANQDDSVQRIVLDVDSPGGAVAGVELAALAVATSPKPVKAVVGSQAASAAYWIASQAEEIEASGRTTQIGSIGVATVAFKEPGVYEIASTNAPKKRPDPATDDGRRAIMEELDAIHEIFAGDVAKGRGVSVETVNKEFGQGGILLAEEAAKRGMIDKVNTPAVGGEAGEAINKQEGKKMTLEEFRASNPVDCKALFDEGIKAERERVAGLSAWKGINAGCDQVVEEAIQQGKSYADIMPQLAAATAKGADKKEETPAAVKTEEPETGLDSEDKEAMKLFGLDMAAIKAIKRG